jgi:uncharacterized protein with NRDE domain
MCTVSFFKTDHQVIITSNRDENSLRPNAIPPMGEIVFGEQLFFPKDPQGGGTWFAANKSGDAFVLLNGAEFNHVPKPSYAKSRGVILQEIAAAKSLHNTWDNIDLNAAAPFTIVAYLQGELMQLRWDGNLKQHQPLSDISWMIWSSSTLYSLTTMEQRKVWFNQFLSDRNGDLTADDLINFHTNTQAADRENGLIIDRKGTMLTKSVTQVVLQTEYFNMRHIDLITHTTTHLTEKIC